MGLSIQAIWDGDALHLWARPNDTDGAASADTDVAALRAALGDMCADGLLGSAVPQGALRLNFPGAAAPSDISGNGHPPTAAVATPADARTLPSLVLAPAQAIDFLTCLRPSPDTAAVVGPSVEYWARLARFVCRLMAARQFIPRVEETADPATFQASWRVLVADREQLQWLERVAAAMPRVCRAVDRGPDSAAEGPDPAQLVESFLGATTDALVRRAVADDPFFRRAHDRSLQPGAGPEVKWLAALLGQQDRTFHITHSEERAAFLQQAQAWLGQLDDTQAAALRLVFILTEPPEADEPEVDDAALVAALTADTSDIAALPEIPAWEPPSWSAAGTEAAAAAETPTAETVPATETPPAEPPEDWTLSLHLQTLDGEGDLIPADSLWGQARGAAPILGRTLAKRQAALLSEIARAAEAFPPARQLLSHPAPAAMILSTTDAHAFIRHWSPLLRERDFGVVLPEWAVMPEQEIGLRLMLSPLRDLDEESGDDADAEAMRGGTGRGKSRRAGASDDAGLSTGHFGLDSLVHFNWQIAVGDARLSPDQFDRLIATGKPLVKHQGRWIQVDLEATRKAAEFLKTQAAGEITLADAFRTAFTAQRAETGLNVIGLTGTAWIEKLLEQSPVASIQAIPQPPGFKGELRPYQLRGLHWLAFLDRLGMGACLADDMGLGKTIQLIVLMLHERDAAASAPSPHLPISPSPDPTVGPTLLFAPTSVVGNWLRELQRFAPSLKLMVHHGPERLAGDTFAKEAQASDVVITSYSLAHRDKDDLARVRWHRLALDEAQKIKNPAAAATMAIRSLYAPHRVALTGTPIENHLSELWSIMQVLNPGLLGTAADFREKFAVPIEKLGERDRAEQLRKMIRPFVLRRTKQDPTIAGDLPEKLEMKVFCNLTAEQAALYQRLVDESLRQIDSASGIRRRGLILATLTRLKQICDHPALLEKDPTVPAAALDHRSGKAERLIDMLEELLEEGDAALVFTQYREMGHLLEKMIKPRLNEPTFFLHGGTPAKGRDDMIQAFQAREKGTPRIFLLSLRAGGLGLNLTAANHVFHFDRWWNPAVEAQATDRAHRVGQTRTVQVHKFVCIGTMEERVDRLLSEKQALADQIVGGGDDFLTNLSTDQLREYLSLGKEAVGEFDER